jgi:hypothetical protein
VGDPGEAGGTVDSPRAQFDRRVDAPNQDRTRNDTTGDLMAERTFTASEVQAAVEAVIRYERARSERLLRLVVANVEAIGRAHRDIAPANDNGSPGA